MKRNQIGSIWLKILNVTKLPGTIVAPYHIDSKSSVAPKLVPDAHGFIWMPADGFRRAVAHKASIDEIGIAAAVKRPIAIQCIREPAPLPGWKTKPSWYLLAEEDRMINPKTQRMGAKVHSYAVDHSPMYTDPNLVIDVIVEAARETRPFGALANSHVE